jgi:ssDNA-binding Zn-finger/Zn-ribbon topoisomerase 1
MIDMSPCPICGSNNILYQSRNGSSAVSVGRNYLIDRGEDKIPDYYLRFGVLFEICQSCWYENEYGGFKAKQREKRLSEIGI